MMIKMPHHRTLKIFKNNKTASFIWYKMTDPVLSVKLSGDDVNKLKSQLANFINNRTIVVGEFGGIKLERINETQASLTGSNDDMIQQSVINIRVATNLIEELSS